MVSDSVGITIIVPCLNEGNNIIKTIDAIVSSMEDIKYDYEIIVVDDGSSDDTSQVVREYLKKFPLLPISLKINETNKGLAKSFIESARIAKGEYVRIVCGDNAEPKETLIEVFKHIGEADIIIFNQIIHGRSFFRILLSKLYTKIVNIISGNSLKYYNGLILCRKEYVVKYQPKSCGFGFQAEMISLMLGDGLNCKEVDVKSYERNSGKSTAFSLKNLYMTGQALFYILMGRISRNAKRCIKIFKYSK